MSPRTALWKLAQRRQRAPGFGPIGSAIGLLAVAALVGCAPPNVMSPTAQSGSSSQPSVSGSGSASIPLASASAAPPASPSIIPGFAYSDILKVEVDNLAVRAAPTRSSPLLRGFRVETNACVPVGEIRLDAGEFVSVHLGPLPIGDTVWYLVWPAVDARLHYGFVSWTTAAEGCANEPGWVAASVGEDQYLSFYREPDPSEYDSFLPDGPRILLVSGTGDYESPPQIRFDLYAFNWAVASAGEPAPCAFKLTLVPEDAGVEGVVAADTSTTDVAQGPIQGPDSIPDTPWGSAAGVNWDTFVVRIQSGCIWTMRLEPLAHD